MNVLEEFQKLLVKENSEQVYQKFLEQNTEFIPREFIQNHGIHLNLILRKFPIAKDYITDFFYLSKSSTDCNCILIEIEKPQSKYFKANNDFHNDFNKASSQISRWRAWFNDNSNMEHFKKSITKLIYLPPFIKESKFYIKYILVHGRREEFEDNTIRRELINTQERSDFKILSYDSLGESLETKRQTYLGVKKNEYIQIESDKFLGENLLVYLKPENLLISEKLKADAILNIDKCMIIKDLKGKKMLEEVIHKIHIKR